MQLAFDAKFAKNYKNASQRARVLTEQWVDSQIFCPNCGHLNIDKYPNNRPAADFYCSNCKEEYELKSKQSNFGVKIVDGAYSTMLERLQSSNNPNFFSTKLQPTKPRSNKFFCRSKTFFCSSNY